MGNLAFSEALLLGIIAMLVVIPLWRIVARAGYPGALSLSIFIPPLALVLLYFLAFAPRRKDV